MTGAATGPVTDAVTVRDGRADPLRLAVTSDLALLAGTVAAALSGQGFTVRVATWPAAAQDVEPAAPAEEAPDLGLALCDLTRPTSLDTARLLVARRPPPWLVLTDAPPGPLWGAVVEAGAALVLSSSTSVADTATAVRQVVAGAIDSAQQAAYVQDWQEQRQARAGRAAVLGVLTPTERDVLAALYAGHSVRGIARTRGVAESTVRHQVAAVRRKLGVDSQLAAVAIYARAQYEQSAR